MTNTHSFGVWSETLDLHDVKYEIGHITDCDLYHAWYQ